ncbi:MAG: Ribonuclease 3 [Planctomycetota bacterium]|jgi:ribonuclease III
MSSVEEINDLLTLCETRIHYEFRDRNLLRRCLTHSSSAETRLDSNERLEFLGDAVLGLVICEYLFQLFPDQREGQLTQMKSWLVSRQTCARVARLLELEPLILVGRGLQQIPDSILSASVEALTAGIYFDGGMDAARQFILRAFAEELQICRPVDVENYKSQLQEFTQRELSCTPEYSVVDESGPDHAREFQIAARIGSRQFPAGRGRSKKEAEQQAARNALSLLLGIPEENPPPNVTDTPSPPPASPACTTCSREPQSVQTIDATVLFSPDSPHLRFLPEGPYALGPGRFSWVAIQHAADVPVGSINLFDIASRSNQSWTLPGRPGFAFPTDQPGVFVAGVERAVGLFDTNTGRWTALIENVDSHVSNTIINDAVIHDGNLIFGCKELEFKTPKAGLYLWRRSDRRLLQLRNDQICSNGKAVVSSDTDGLILYDIDSCTKQIIRCRLDPEAGTVSHQQIVVDLTSEAVFPDGMILTPDEQSLIVALYNPGDPEAGEARQYRLQDGQLERIWRCPGSPRVTCPQLVEHNGRVWLLLTTAVEGMSSEQQQRHPTAGSLFIAETDFHSIGSQPLFPVP